jgi:MYXO-CTERM domain-containing protein
VASKITNVLTWSVSLAALVLAPASVFAAPQLSFDSWNGDDLTTKRVAGNSPGALITIANDTYTITNIAVRVDLNIPGSLKFVIFSHGQHDLIYVSPPKFFADVSMSWKQSDTFSIELPPGQYDIGAIASVGGKWQYDQEIGSIGDFSSIVANPNFSNYAQPSSGGHATADAAVRLYIENEICGDGMISGGEACDDGNDDNTDECLDTCELASCGDGFVWTDEEACDDGNDDNTDACLASCVIASCGDGFVWADYEPCDDGNDDNLDNCLDSCANASCGDGYVGPGEACDDANMVDDDACSNMCVTASCGDGELQDGEQCDDGNITDDDDCTNACTTPVCGDAIIQTGEACDDGDDDDADECTNMCTTPICGDAIVQSHEECDDGNDVIDDECTNDCRAPACGDGIVQASEACDDGNDQGGDGCEIDCTFEAEGSNDDTGGGEHGTGGDTGSWADDGDGVGEDCNCTSDADRRGAIPLAVFGLGLFAALRRRWR